MHTGKISKNTLFSALFKPQVPAQEVQSPYLDLAQKVDVLRGEYSDVFLLLEGIVPERNIEFRIDLKDEQAAPPPPYHYRSSQVEIAEARKQLDDLLKYRWAHPSYSPYGAPILFDWKLSRDLRMCVDFRMLN